MDGANHKQHLYTNQAAEYIGRSPGALRNLVMRREIPFRKVAGRLVFLRDELEKWLSDPADGLTWEEYKRSRD